MAGAHELVHQDPPAAAFQYPGDELTVALEEWLAEVKVGSTVGGE